LFDLAHPAPFLADRDRAVTINLEAGTCGFAPCVILTDLLGNLRKDGGDSRANRFLRLTNHAQDRQTRRRDGTEQLLEDLGRRGQEVRSAQNTPAENLPHDPQLVIALLRLEPVEREDDSPVRCDRVCQALAGILLARAQQGPLHLDQILDVALRDPQGPKMAQFLPDLCAGALLIKAQGPYPPNHVEPVARPFDLTRLGPR
jgi:hypothetical protein